MKSPVMPLLPVVSLAIGVKVNTVELTAGYSAVFLRMIEYYEGILFLTTNRDRNFDEAILNRIHLAVTYPPHDANTRSIIWQGLVERNFSLKTDCCWTEEAYTQLGQLKLNGREIKNTLRTADAFARSEGQSLSIMHIVEVLEAVADERHTAVIKKLSQIVTNN
ncbi:uncharacterized protein BJX67DRAFT_86266 [Aspergillus lucknowensis]|uniref:Uncharacterized protein n=1 Tax=Aspergillus lucknowensis TaxID=176173 RepID=A0ABR4LSB8_9EURO